MTDGKHEGDHALRRWLVNRGTPPEDEEPVAPTDSTEGDAGARPAASGSAASRVAPLPDSLRSGRPSPPGPAGGSGAISPLPPMLDPEHGPATPSDEQAEEQPGPAEQAEDQPGPAEQAEDQPGPDERAGEHSPDSAGDTASPPREPTRTSPGLASVVTMILLLLTITAAGVTGWRAWHEGTQQAMTEFFICALLAGLAWAARGAARP